ncbi:MAG: RHS repeat-associated core domain-containing protein [Phycisphaerales bacterium]
MYDDRWRLVTVYKETSTDPILYELNVPHAAGADGFGGSSYIDSWALRERDKNLDETLETRSYYVQNWRADLISELTDALSSWTYAGSIRYSAYGEHEFLTLGDVSDKTPVALRDGVLTSEDSSQISTWYGASNLAGDLDDGTETGVPDGNMTIDDVIFEATLYSIDGLVPDNPRFLYAGYVHDPVIGSAASALPSATGSGLYHVRNRVYNPELGRWTRRDPLFGLNQEIPEYAYCLSEPIVLSDYSGLVAIELPCNATPGQRAVLNIIQSNHKKCLANCMGAAPYWPANVTSCQERCDKQFGRVASTVFPNAKWIINSFDDFIWLYYNGNGLPAKMSDSMMNRFRGHPGVRRLTYNLMWEVLDDIAYDAAAQCRANPGRHIRFNRTYSHKTWERDVTGLTALFPLGDGNLTVTAACSVNVKCSKSGEVVSIYKKCDKLLSFDDWFKEPVDIDDFELDGCTKYYIEGCTSLGNDMDFIPVMPR